MTNGLAVRSADTLGASDLQPLPLRLVASTEPLAPTTALPIASGAPLPRGADAVLPTDGFAIVGSMALLRADVAVSENVLLPHSEGGVGDPVFAAGHRLRAVDLPWLVQQQMAQVDVVRRPRVQVVSDYHPDGSGLLVAARCEAVGAEVLPTVAQPTMATTGPDLWITVGRSDGQSPTDWPHWLARHGELALHGAAVQPAISLGVGQWDGVPVVLLPGAPVATCCGLDVLVLPLLRRWLASPPPSATPLPLLKKLSSAPGWVEYWRVQRRPDGLWPLAAGAAARLTTLTRADGFVLVEAAAEGFAAGHALPFYAY